jgi:hypothetical protein
MFVLPTIPDFKSQFQRDFPFATPLSKSGVVGAEASASINGSGEVSVITVTEAGSGYTGLVPAVVIYGGGGISAAALATITTGAVASIAVTKPGFGYQKVPRVYIPVGGDNTDNEKVTDYDLARAFNAAEGFNASPSFFSTQSAYTYANNLLAAHYLCENLQASGVGLGGKAEWLTQSKTVGNVSEAYAIPDRVLKSPFLAKLSKTTYGAQFLELVSPQLIGNIKSFHGVTHP